MHLRRAPRTFGSGAFACSGVGGAPLRGPELGTGPGGPGKLTRRPSRVFCRGNILRDLTEGPPGMRRPIARKPTAVYFPSPLKKTGDTHPGRPFLGRVGTVELGSPPIFTGGSKEALLGRFGHKSPEADAVHGPQSSLVCPAPRFRGAPGAGTWDRTPQLSRASRSQASGLWREGGRGAILVMSRPGQPFHRVTLRGRHRRPSESLFPLRVRGAGRFLWG
jgi:hypothetical protein